MKKYKKLFSYFRWILSSIALFFVWRLININDLILIFNSVKINYIVLALLILFFIRILVAYRWSLLLRSQGYQIPNFKLLKIMLVSDAIGTFLPSNLSKEGIRGFALWKYIGKAADSFTSIVVDRISGLFALSGIAFIGSLISFEKVNDWKFIVLFGILFGLCILMPLIILVIEKFRILEKFQRSNVPYIHKISSKLLSVLESFSNFKMHKRTLLKVLGLSTVVQFLRIYFIFCLAYSLGVDIPFIQFCVFLPIIMLLFMLPISVAGIGIQEAAYIYFFTPLGMLAEEAVALSVLDYAAVILLLLIGWAIYAKEGIGGKKISYKRKAPAIV